MLMDDPHQVSTSCDAKNVSGRHSMEESGPTVITVSHVLRGGISLLILLGFCRGHVKGQLDWCGVGLMLMGISLLRYMSLFKYMGLSLII